jgi:serine/threonine protein phosphatase PrpC
VITETFGESVIGASHVRAGTICQDSHKIVQRGNATVFAVADGHGSAAAEFSNDGSGLAVDVFCTLMEGFIERYQLDTHMTTSPALVTYLNREGQTKVARTITEEWRALVLKTHMDLHREIITNDNGDVDDAAILKKYGTTLLGMLVANDFFFAFQLGDGDIMRVDENGIEPIIQADKLLGVETHSMSKIDGGTRSAGKAYAWESSFTKFMRINRQEGLPYAYFLTTDGFANSYASEEDFHKALLAYYAVLNQHGIRVLSENLAKWLSETSADGCGDDVTMVVCYNS